MKDNRLDNAYFELDKVDLELLTKFCPYYKDMDDKEILDYLKEKYWALNDKEIELSKELACETSIVMDSIHELTRTKESMSDGWVRDRAEELADAVIRSRELREEIDTIEDEVKMEIYNLIFVCKQK